jgi:hypothetical protein
MDAKTLENSPNIVSFIQRTDEGRKLQKTSPEEYFKSGNWQIPLIFVIISEIGKAGAFLGSEGLIGTYKVDIQKGVL